MSGETKTPTQGEKLEWMLAQWEKPTRKGVMLPGTQMTCDVAAAAIRAAITAPDLLAALQAQEAADDANERRLGYTEWQGLEDKAKALRVAAISKAEGRR